MKNEKYLDRVNNRGYLMMVFIFLPMIIGVFAYYSKIYWLGILSAGIFIGVFMGAILEDEFIDIALDSILATSREESKNKKNIKEYTMERNKWKKRINKIFKIDGRFVKGTQGLFYRFEDPSSREKFEVCMGDSSEDDLEVINEN